MTPVKKMTPVKNTKNHAQRTDAGETGETEDIFSTEGGNGDSRPFQFCCYHCNDFHTNNQDYYENHIVRDHYKLPAYPSAAGLERRGLQAQGKEWEI